MNVDVIATLKGAAAIVGPFIGAGGMWKFMSERSRTHAPKQSSPSQITESQADLVTAVNDQTKTILEENTRLRRESNRDRRTLSRKVDVLTRQVAECQSKHIECELKADELKIQVEALMRQAPAEYNEIARVGHKDL